jgi:hypothetical protein
MAANGPSNEWTEAASDLCQWAQREGLAAFVIHTLESGNVRFIGPQLPPALVARMLRAAADGYEAQVSDAPVTH